MLWIAELYAILKSTKFSSQLCFLKLAECSNHFFDFAVSDYSLTVCLRMVCCRRGYLSAKESEKGLPDLAGKQGILSDIFLQGIP